MATSDSILGLFTPPEQLQQAQRANFTDQALTAASLDPNQLANFYGMQGGYALGNVIGGALGAEDPQMQRMSARTSLAQGEDFNTSEGWANYAKKLQQAGDMQGAIAAAAKSRELDLTSSQITKNLHEGRAAGTKISEVGVAAGTREPVYTYQTPTGIYQVVFKDVNGQQQMVPYTGGVDRTTSRTSVSVDNKGETEFAKELGKLDAKKVSESMTAKGAAIDQLKTLQKMAEVEQRPVISGSMAEQRTDVSNFFNTIGLSSSSDKLKTANSQEYIKYSTGLVLDNLKKTGYNPSNADMKVVQSLIPRLETDPIARRELIKFMSEKANEVVTEANSMEDYARRNKGLSGYTPKVPQVNIGGNAAPNPYAGMSDAELAARIARAQAAQRGGK
jgi:hypothetical protein